eukprot:CAMPEP_0197826634 /NCGR_PEP_ID=MMETSP1437-20131217/3570_1 /TAXON_ID=49252 ORGANISM="Eucampia antarctica, Strain CCMP1452" /NCGR_SAMPLE_ID=MMETSP1437 /ASSEMBLY_ACC=CAM_ASM_001096 /LENGTH=604 /DNA_ID=CAMNT_0043427155 /DNA_START=246 /DNA_END=2057 /DNA_ORIENTATION=-
MVMMSVDAFSSTGSISSSSSTFGVLNRGAGTVLYGVNRRSKRNQKKETEQSRPKSFYDGIEDAEGGDGKKKKKKKKRSSEEKEKTSVVGTSSQMSDASKSEQQQQQANEDRPLVSRIVVDEETGIERIQQGERVMDVLSRKAVELSTMGPEYRMAQMFPGVSPEVRQQYRLSNPSDFTVPQMISALETVLLEENGDVSEITSSRNDEALDFVLANRDLLGGWKMLKTFGRMKLKAQSEGQKERALYLRQLWKRLWTLEDSLNAPFRQMVLDAEARVGPNFGNLDVTAFASGHLYERTSNYLVLKGMVAHWEKKVNDAQFVETAQKPPNKPNDVDFLELLMVGDPKRYLPDPPIIFRYNECVRIALMAQNMTKQFVSTPELYNDLPPEIRFVEDSSFIKGGTALREYMVNTFCPQEDITPQALREGLKRLEVQMSNLQIDPYGDLRNVVSRLGDAICVGSGADEHDPYLSYLVGSIKPDSPGFFQTYTMDHDRQSMVRFLDSAKSIQQGSIGPTDNLAEQLTREASNLFGFGAKPKQPVQTETNKNTSSQTQKVPYKTPDERASGRPHNLGWLELLGDEEMTGGSLTKDKDNENSGDEIFESDNW